MKKIRTFLTISTILLAIAGAFASSSVYTTIYYKYEIIIDDCVCVPCELVSTDCGTFGANICTCPNEPTIPLRRDNNCATSCGAIMFRPY